MEWELKRWKEAYAGQLQSAADAPETAAMMPLDFPTPFTPDDAQAFISAQLLSDDTRILSRAVIVNGAVSGGVTITAKDGIYEKSAELSFWIVPEYRRCGIMSGAVDKLVSKAFGQLGVTRIYALPFADNVAARRVLNACGFNLEGTMKKAAYRDGVMHDSCLYALIDD